MKERDDALLVAYHELGMKDVSFNVADMERVWGDVVAPPFDEPEWDINGQGRVCLWMDEDGFVRLGDISGGGERAYNMPAAEWMEV